MAADLFGDTAGNRGCFDHLPDPRAHRTQAFGVAGGEPGQLIQQRNELTVACYDLSIGVGGDTETLRHPDPADPGEFPEVGALASGQFEQGPVDLLEAQHRPGHPRSPVVHPAALRRTQRRIAPRPDHAPIRSVRAVFLRPHWQRTRVDSWCRPTHSWLEARRTCPRTVGVVRVRPSVFGCPSAGR